MAQNEQQTDMEHEQDKSNEAQPGQLRQAGVMRSWRITGVEFLFAWYDLWIGLFWDKKETVAIHSPLAYGWRDCEV